MKKKFVKMFVTGFPSRSHVTWGDAVVILCIVLLLTGGAMFAYESPGVVKGTEITLSRRALPFYAFLSVLRMATAYALALSVALMYGYVAATHRRSEKILIPLLDVLQSVPILSFLPVALLSLSAILPSRIAAELACIILIFTSQVWNLILTWYQSLTTLPVELKEAGDIFRFDSMLKFKILQLPFGAIGLVWNSMMSWAGGWFFLMAAETFTVGERNFRLPGLGTYLHEAAAAGDLTSVAWGIGTLVLLVVVLDQLVWQPLLVWSEKFKLETVDTDEQSESWFRNAVQRSQITKKVINKLILTITRLFDRGAEKFFGKLDKLASSNTKKAAYINIGAAGLCIVVLYTSYRCTQMLSGIEFTQWKAIVIGLAATLARVFFALVLALLWTVPVGILIGSSKRFAPWLKPIVQIAASVPSTALFPVVLLLFLQIPSGLNISAVILMLMGAQWYLLFNIIAGANSIPQDLKQTAALLQMKRWQQFRTVTLPALLPFIVTGAITASGGAWNASVVAEYVQFGGQTVSTTGIGSLIAEATSNADYPLLLAATLSLVLTVIVINRLFWKRIYRLAEERFTLG